MEKVPETLTDFSKYGFHTWNTQAFKNTGKKSKDCASTGTSEKDGTEEEGSDDDDVNMVKVPLKDEANEMLFANGTAGNVRFINFMEYHQADLFVRTERIEDLDVPLPDVSLSHVTYLRASFRMYGFDFSRAHYL